MNGAYIILKNAVCMPVFCLLMLSDAASFWDEGVLNPNSRYHNHQNEKAVSMRSTGIDNIMAYAGDDDQTFDLPVVFDLAPGEATSYELPVNSKPWVAGGSIDDEMLTISFLTNGQTNMVIQANTANGSFTESFVVGVMPVVEGDYLVSDFGDLSLPDEGYWNGSDESGGFVSGTVWYPNEYVPAWGSWSGWAYSNITDNTTPGWLNQYSAITGGALDANDSGNDIYAVSFVTDQGSIVSFNEPSAHEVKGFFVTNSTFAALSMMYGDAYAKQFGGPTGNDPDWFKLTATGFRNHQQTATVDFYLADYRYADNTENYIIQTWQWLELSSLGKVDSLLFTLSSTDVGDWGMNTPAYFAIDRMHIVPDMPPYVANPLENIYLFENEPDKTIDITQIFSDPDDDDDAIIITIKEQTNPQLLEAQITNNNTLVLSLHPDQTGVSHVTLEGLSNGKTVEAQFTVFVSPVSDEEQYISEVIAYKPAPGQFINKEPWGMPSSAETLIGGINGTLSLGAFGGYVIFRFEEAVINHPDNPYGVDFVIFGNALPHWSEPGVVWVMKDENDNGVPDGTWYRLAGSDHFFSSTIHDYEVTYINPGSQTAENVPWHDNYGNSGYVAAHAAHNQPYYPLHDHFPDIDPQQYTLQGTRLAEAVDMSHPAMIQSPRRAFGYADNTVRGVAPFNVPDNPYTTEVQNAGGDGFDISWAIDEQGNYVDLDKIHFIKVQTAVLANAGWMGEVSTEITGAVKVRPDAGITGVTDIIVIKDLPNEITTNQFQLEAVAFHYGRKMYGAKILWSANLEGASVDENMVLHLHQSGELTLTAWLESDPGVFATVNTTVNLADDPTNTNEVEEEHPVIYPNPASDYITVSGKGEMHVSIFDLSGRCLLEVAGYVSGSRIDFGHLPAGVYFVRIQVQGTWVVEKVIRF